MSNEELAQAIKDGNTDLQIQLWNQVERWVTRTALRWFIYYNGGKKGTSCRGVELADLMQVGFVAMLTAVDTFDAEKGAFIGWLTFRLKTAFAKLYGVRTERDRQDPLNNALSLDAPLSADDPDGDTLVDAVLDESGENGYRDIEEDSYITALRAALEKALDGIPPKEAETIRREYFGNESQTEIADDLSVSTSEISRRERKAFSYLRKPKVIATLEEFNCYSGTGLNAWKNSGASVEERFAILADRFDRIKSGNYNRTTKKGS